MLTVKDRASRGDVRYSALVKRMPIGAIGAIAPGSSLNLRDTPHSGSR